MISLQKKISGCEITFLHNEKHLLFNPLLLKKEMVNLGSNNNFSYKVLVDFNFPLQQVNKSIGSLKKQEILTQASFFDSNAVFSFALRRFKSTTFNGLFIRALRDSNPYFDYYKILDAGKLVNDLNAEFSKIINKQIPKGLNGQVFFYINHLNQYLIMKKDPDSFIWIGNGNILDDQESSNYMSKLKKPREEVKESII
jgi:hypothetical protein